MWTSSFAAFPGPAPLHSKLDGFTAIYGMFNLTGWPAAVVRAGTRLRASHGRAGGSAPPWREDIALAAARHVEQALGPWPALSELGSG
jgi:amidase